MAATKKVRAKGEKWRPVHTDRARRQGPVDDPTQRVHDVNGYGGWSFSKVLQPGQQATRRFRQRGTFRFRCVRLFRHRGREVPGQVRIVHVI